MTELFAHIPRRIRESYQRHETTRDAYNTDWKWSDVLATIVTNIDYHYYKSEADLSNLAVLKYFYNIYKDELISGKLTKEEISSISRDSKGDRHAENSVLLREVCRRVTISGLDFVKLVQVYSVVKGVLIEDPDTLRGLVEDISNQINDVDTEYVTKALTWWYQNKYSKDVVLRDLLDNIYSKKYNEYDQDKPRLLTKLEIETIVSSLPEPKHSIRRLREHMRRERQDDLRRMLRTVSISPSKIPELNTYIVTDFENAQVAEYTAVGIAAAEAMGGPITQMALNSFHASGSAKSVSRGTEKFTEVFNASKTIKTPTMRLKFRDPLITFDDVIDKRREFVNVDVKSLIREAQILPVTEETEWWYSVFEIYTGKQIPESTVFLRLILDTVEMYSYGITMSMLENMIVQNDSKLITVVSSPIQEGIIDVYVDLDQIAASSVQDISISESLQELVSHDEFILGTIVYPRIMSTRIGGIKQIVNLEHAKIGTVLDFVLSEILIKQDQGYYTYQIKVNDKTALLHGFDITQLELSLIAVGFDVTIVSNTKTHIEFEAKSMIKDRKDKPSALIGAAIIENNKDEDMYENELKTRGVKTYRRRDPTLISMLTDVYRADTFGINFAQILKRSDIDPNHTYSNDMHEILRYFGIGATKSYIIQTINEALSNNGTYIDSRHFFLISDYMTSLGYITPINFAGSIKYSYNTLSLASQQSAYSVISNAAITGTKEYVTGYTDHIAYGQLMRHSVLGNPEIDYKTLPGMDLDKIDESFNNINFNNINFNVVDYQSNITAGTYVADTTSGDQIGMNASAFKGQVTITTVDDLFEPTVGHLISPTVEVIEDPKVVFIPSIGKTIDYDLVSIKSRVVGFDEKLITLDMVNPISYVILPSKFPTVDTLYTDVGDW